MHELEQTLNAVRQVHLASLPTPLARLSRLEQQWGHSGLYIKRDDVTGLGPGGNKPRPVYSGGGGLRQGGAAVHPGP